MRHRKIGARSSFPGPAFSSLRRSDALWAAIDGLAQRGVTATLSLLLAYLVDPGVLGGYFSILLGLSLYQVGFELPCRQAAFRALDAVDGAAFIKRVSRAGAAASPLLLSGYAAVLVLTHKLDPAAAIMLAPFALVPVATTFSLPTLAALQRDGRWRSVAGARVTATGVSLIVCVPVLFVTGNVVAAAMQVLLAEILLAFLLRSRSSQVMFSAARGRDLRPAALLQDIGYQVLGWIRVQGDRAFVIVFSTAAVLGVYSIALALSRTVVEAPLGALLSVLRSRLARGERPDDVDEGRLTLNRFMLRLGLMALGAFLVVQFAVRPLLASTLDDSWVDAIALTSVLSVGIFPVVYTWTMDSAAAHFQRTSRGYVNQVAGILMGVGVGYAIAQEPLLGCWLYVGRETIAAVGSAISHRVLVHRQSVVVFTSLMAGAATVSIVTVGAM